MRHHHKRARCRPPEGACGHADGMHVTKPSITTPTLRLHVAIALTFVALTVLVTYPQVRGFATSVPYHSDPYFSMWRLGWVAHALRTNPRGLFDANIFYPADNTLAYSDAMLLPGVALAPLFWAGMHPVIIYNAALFTAFALSGHATFLLARRLTGNVAAAMVAGVIYAFAPYRFTHYTHLELQLVFWVPFALLLLHRILADGRVRDGVLLGLTVAGQLLSCIYVGIFSLAYFTVLVPVLLVLTGVRQARRLLVPTLVAALLTIVIVAPYALVYMRTERSVGARSVGEIRVYSASTASYLSAPAMNRLYGWTAITDPLRADEMNLFPGAAAVALALLGVLGGRGRVKFAYLAGLAFTVEMTRGSSSFVYLWLFEHVRAFQALRSPARIDILVNLSLAVLSAYGVAFLLARIGHRTWSTLTGAALVALLVAEYASAPLIAPAPAVSRIDKLLSQPTGRDYRGVAAHLSERRLGLVRLALHVSGNEPFPEDAQRVQRTCAGGVLSDARNNGLVSRRSLPDFSPGSTRRLRRCPGRLIRARRADLVAGADR